MSPQHVDRKRSARINTRTVTVGAVAVILLVAVVGAFANGGLFSFAFDPSSFLDNASNSRTQLDQGDNSSYRNEDNATGDKADVQGEQDEEQPMPQSAVPDEGQSAGVAAVAPGDGANAVPGAVGPGAGVVPGDGQQGQNQTDPNNPGGQGSNTADPDRPPAVAQPAAMQGVSLLSLKHTGTAVLSTSGDKGSIDPEQSLSDVVVTAVLYDKDTGTKWTRTLTYGNVDGQTFTVSSDSFPITSDTTSITIVYYLYGERYEAELPCVVGDKLNLTPTQSYFDNINVDQNIPLSELAENLKVDLSGTPVDLSLCQIDGFDTTKGAGTYTATVSYAGLSATFDYVIKEVGVRLHTPEALVNCDMQDWGHEWGFSPTGMCTLFNGQQYVDVTLNSSSLDLSVYTRQLSGDLYWTQDPEWKTINGPDINFDFNYVKPGTDGQLDNWFVGWATADPALTGGAVDQAWLAEHLLDSVLSAADIAAIAAEQGTTGSVDLYPVMRADTTINADDYIVKYNEVSATWTMYSDRLDDRRPAQLLAGFSQNAVNDGVLTVPAGVTYVSLSPYLSDAEDTSAYASVTQVNMPTGLLNVDQCYPAYGWPYYSFDCDLFASGDVLPNLNGFTLPESVANHGSSAYRTCEFTVEHPDGQIETILGLVSPTDQLMALPSAGVSAGDKLKMAEGAGVRGISAVAIDHITAESIEFASSVLSFEQGSLRSCSFNTVILNSPATIPNQAFAESSFGEFYDVGARGYTSLVIRSTDVANMLYNGWCPFFDESDNTFENLLASGVHIYVPDEATLVRCYSAWSKTIDDYYGILNEEDWSKTPRPATAYLLCIEGEDTQPEIYSDANGVVYMRGAHGVTLLYAPASLTGYYEIPSDVVAISPGAFAECTSLAGIIVNPRDDGKLPQLGEYAFGMPDGTGYAAPPDTLKIYVSNTLEGEEQWTSALRSEYWHNSSQEAADNADLLVSMVFNNDYPSYKVDAGTLYALTKAAASEDEQDGYALIRAGEDSKGVFEVLDGTVAIEAFAFAGCEAITGVVNIDNVKEIGNTAFLDCKMLNVIALPKALESLGNSAFLGCQRLEAVAFNSAPTVGEDVFEQANLPTVFLPSGAHASSAQVDELSAALTANGCSQFEQCAYDDGLYSLLHADPSASAWVYYYRGLYTENSDATQKQVTFAGSNLGDADWGDVTQSINLDKVVTEIPEGVFANQPYLMGVYGGDSVRVIGNGAFKDCPELRDVSLGFWDSAIEWIGDDAFSGCGNLNNVIFPLDAMAVPSGTFHVGDRAFKGCTSFTHPGYGPDFNMVFLFPNDVNVEIGSEAFEDCAAIGTLYLPQSDTNIGSRAFAGCSGLTSIVTNGERSGFDLVIGADAFGDSPLTFVSLPGAQVTIQSGAFASSRDMYALFIPEGATVADDAFLPGSVSSHVVGTCPNNVNAGATYDGTGVDEIVSTTAHGYDLPNTFVAVSYSYDEFYGMKTILFAGNDVVDFSSGALAAGSYALADGAFEGSEALESVSLVKEYGFYGGQITAMGQGVFKDCVNLANTGLESDDLAITSVSASCYQGCASLFGTGMSSYTPIQSIGEYAFAGCTGIDTLDLSLYTTHVGDYAFAGCTGLTAINHWCSPTEGYSDCALGAGAFEGCTALQTYDSSYFLKSVGPDCFKGCDNLTWHLYWTGSVDDASTFSLPTLGEHPFGLHDDGTPVIPSADRIMIYFDDPFGTAVGENAAQIAAQFTDDNGWLPFAQAFTFVNAAGEKSVFDGTGFVTVLSVDEDAKAEAESVLPEADQPEVAPDSQSGVDPEAESASDAADPLQEGDDPDAKAADEGIDVESKGYKVTVDASEIPDAEDTAA